MNGTPAQRQVSTAARHLGERLGAARRGRRRPRRRTRAGRGRRPCRRCSGRGGWTAPAPPSNARRAQHAGLGVAQVDRAQRRRRLHRERPRAPAAGGSGSCRRSAPGRVVVAGATLEPERLVDRRSRRARRAPPTSSGSKIRFAKRSPSRLSTVDLPRKWSTRNTWSSGTSLASTSVERARAVLASVPNGFSRASTSARSGSSMLGQRAARGRGRPRAAARSRRRRRPPRLASRPCRSSGVGDVGLQVRDAATTASSRRGRRSASSRPSRRRRRRRSRHVASSQSSVPPRRAQVAGPAGRETLAERGHQQPRRQVAGGAEHEQRG